MVNFKLILTKEQLKKLQVYVDRANYSDNPWDRAFYLGYLYGVTQHTDHMVDYVGDQIILIKESSKRKEAVV